jgi:hypothetical protein
MQGQKKQRIFFLRLVPLLLVLLAYKDLLHSKRVIEADLAALPVFYQLAGASSSASGTTRGMGQDSSVGGAGSSTAGAQGAGAVRDTRRVAGENDRDEIGTRGQSPIESGGDTSPERHNRSRND